MMRAKYILFLIAIVTCTSLQAQVSPPGIDGARVVGWGAIGVSQQLSPRFTITVYAGGSRQSDPDNTQLLKKSAIFVVNQETMYSFDKTWQLALGTSFRRQDVYTENEPYNLQHPGIRDELRYYLRLFHKASYRKLAFVYSFRPEYRTFYTNDWDTWKTPLELRFRLKGQVNIPLNESKSNQLIIADEVLTAIDHYKEPNDHGDRWSSYHFTEDRFTNYFRHTFQKPSVVVDLGIMHQFWKEKEGHAIHYTAYLSFDVLVQNPFGHKGS